MDSNTFAVEGPVLFNRFDFIDWHSKGIFRFNVGVEGYYFMGAELDFDG